MDALLKMLGERLNNLKIYKQRALDRDDAVGNREYSVRIEEIQWVIKSIERVQESDANVENEIQ